MIPDSVFRSTLDELFQPIMRFMEDDSVSEIVINGPSSVFIEQRGRMLRTASRFDSDAALVSALRVLAQYVGRPFDLEHPILEGRMPDGSRVEAVLAPLAKGGAHVAIRRFQKDKLSVEQLVSSGSVDQPTVALLRSLVENKKNVLVAGGTGTGKTSLLNVLTGFIPEHERVVVLEDARELMPRSAHVVQLESRPADERGKGAVSVRALFKATLRLRPDRIVVGEIRDGTALDLIQAMTSGHGGCLSTLHASHPRDALMRLETMALMADVELPLRALRSQIASAVDVVVQIGRVRSGARLLTHVSRVGELDEQGRYVLHEMVVRRGVTDQSPGRLEISSRASAYASSDTHFSEEGPRDPA